VTPHTRKPAPSRPAVGGGLRRTALADEAYERLKALLMDNTFEPGARLTTDYLAEQLQVSRTPVRESLVRLEAEGLLVKRPMAGYSVRPPLDQVGLDHLYTVRSLLEPEATRLAASNATDEQLASLRQAGPRSTPSTRGRYEDYRAFVTLDADFHDTVALASGNTLLRESIQRLHAHIHTYRLWAYGSAEPIAALREHAVITEALCARDPATAEAAMRAHLQGAHARLSTAFTAE
jgi:DNA-binding GntR family transcriptional regulator